MREFHPSSVSFYVHYSVPRCGHQVRDLKERPGSDPAKLSNNEAKLNAARQRLQEATGRLYKGFGYYDAVGGTLCQPEIEMFKKAQQEFFAAALSAVRFFFSCRHANDSSILFFLPSSFLPSRVFVFVTSPYVLPHPLVSWTEGRPHATVFCCCDCSLLHASHFVARIPRGHLGQDATPSYTLSIFLLLLSRMNEHSGVLCTTPPMMRR